MQPLIIEARVNEYRSRNRNPHVPYLADEIGRDARACREAGASIVHFHPRHADGAPDHSSEGQADAARAIRARSDLLPLTERIILAGGHVSIGLGDYPYTQLGQPTNAELVHRVAGQARALGQDVATPDVARGMLGIPAMAA